MAKLNGKKSPSKTNARQIAASWLSLGVAPVPLRPRSKKPKGGRRWNKAKIAPEEIGEHFNRGDNVGGLWGQPSGWIVDVDLDCREAVTAARILLPETFTYGRASRPRSHFLYRCKGITSVKFSIHKGPVLAEIRSTGCQSVLPPSIHPEGDRFEINKDLPFTTITRDELTEKVQKVAAVALLAQCFPESGGRHDFIHALCGALLWTYWKEDDVRTFMEALLDCVDEKETDRGQRERTIENTIEHFKQGSKISGWKTLSGWVPKDDLRNLKWWLKAEKVSEQIPEYVKHNAAVPFDTDLLKVPGLVGDIARWAERRSYALQPVFSLAAALQCVAFAAQNQYVVEGWDTPLQPFFMLLAPTASGKESALDSVYALARKSGLEEQMFQGFQSYHAMLDQLAEPPNAACWLWDEAARKLRSAGKSQGGQDFQIITWLLQFYGKANSYIAGIPGRKQSIKSIDHPFLTIFAASQPSQMIEAITASDVSMGLINRFVLIDAGDELPEPNLERTVTFPSRIEDAIRKFRRVNVPTGEYPFVKVRFESAATWNHFREFNEEARKLSIQGGGWEMWGRANQNALILAGIVAIGIDPDAPVITFDIAEWATRFLTWSSNCWTMRVENSSARTVVEVNSKHVERIIRNPNVILNRSLPSEKSHVFKGLIPKSMITRLSRHIKGRDLDDALNQLVQAGVVGCGDSDGIEVYWPKI